MIAAFWLLQMNDPAKDIRNIDSGGLLEYLKLLLVLGLVLALAFVALRIGLPRIKGIQRVVPGAIQVAAQYPLESNKNLYVIRIGRAHLLIGTADSTLHFLTALDSSDVESALATADPPPPREFAGLMQAFRRRRNSSRMT